MIILLSIILILIIFFLIVAAIFVSIALNNAGNGITTIVPLETVMPNGSSIKTGQLIVTDQDFISAYNYLSWSCLITWTALIFTVLIAIILLALRINNPSSITNTEMQIDVYRAFNNYHSEVMFITILTTFVIVFDGFLALILLVLTYLAAVSISYSSNAASNYGNKAYSAAIWAVWFYFGVFLLAVIYLLIYIYDLIKKRNYLKMTLIDYYPGDPNKAELAYYRGRFSDTVAEFRESLP